MFRSWFLWRNLHQLKRCDSSFLCSSCNIFSLVKNAFCGPEMWLGTLLDSWVKSVLSCQYIAMQLLRWISGTGRWVFYKMSFCLTSPNTFPTLLIHTCFFFPSLHRFQMWYFSFFLSFSAQSVAFPRWILKSPKCIFKCFPCGTPFRDFHNECAFLSPGKSPVSLKPLGLHKRLATNDYTRNQLLFFYLQVI